MPNFSGQTIPGGPTKVLRCLADIAARDAIPVSDRNPQVIYVVQDSDGAGTAQSYVWDETVNDWKPTSENVVTVLGAAAVDATDPQNVVVTIPYANEDGTNPDVVFSVPIPAPVSVVNSIDLKPTGSPNEFTVEIVYTDDGGVQQTITDTTPVTLASPCPEPMTRAQLIALRNAGELDLSCHYTLTDYNRGTVGAASITLTPVSNNALSMDAKVLTGFDNIAWSGLYDIDSNRLTALEDNVGNVVRGEGIVDTFPWGNANVYSNTVNEAALFTYIRGNVFNNVFETGARVTLDGAAGNFARNSIGEDSDVTWRNGDFRDNLIRSDAVVVSDVTGDFDNNDVFSFAQVNASGATNVDQNYFGQNSRLTISAGSFNQNHIGTDSQFTSAGGTHYENTVEGSSTVVLTGNNNFYQNTLTRNSSVVMGSINFYANEVANSVINTTGSTGPGIRACKFYDSRANSTMQNVAVLDMSAVTVSNNSSLSISGAARCYLRYFTLENYGRLLQSAGTQLDANYTGVRDYSYIQVLGGRVYANYCSLAGVAYIQQASTVTGTNRLDSVNLQSRGRVRFLGTVSNCRVYYSTVTSGGYVEHRGSSTGCYVYYCTVTSSSAIYSNNSVNWRAYYNTVEGNSEISTQGVTATHYAYYNVMSAHGYLRHRDSSGGRLYAIKCSGQALVTMQGSTAAGRLYYSTFGAYYYLTALNWTVTRTALHGYGRRSYTVTNPPNGAFTQNF